jgi:hypothetical protein
MADFQRLSQEHDTSIEILWAIAEQYGDDEDKILDILENPPDFDAVVSGARYYLDDPADELRWQGRGII